MKGRIIKNISNDYTIDANHILYTCKPRGKFRINNMTPLVGDIVTFDEINYYITDIEPRKNKLIRPSIANIDAAVIVTSVKKPDFDSHLLDKTLTIISYNNITPIIYFTKLDLLNDEELIVITKYINYYKKIGYQVLKLKTDEISDALGRGKHTTRHTELYDVNGTFIADTPGFSKIEFYDMTKMDIRDNMKEMFDNLEYCKYSDCMHINEDGCHVIKLVTKGEIIPSRYDNYLNFIRK